MRTKDLNMLKVIECLSLKEKEMSVNEIAKYFHITTSGEKDSTKGPFSYRTLQRYMTELEEIGYIYKNGNKYGVNGNSFQFIMSDEWKRIVRSLLECGEIEVSKKLQSYAVCTDSFAAENDLVTKYNRRIYEPLKILKASPNIIQTINTAMEENKEILMNYKNSKTIEYLFPVCYLINRNASRIYLIGLKGKKLSTPYELEGIKNVETGRKLEVDRNKYIDLIQEAWDVDIQEPTEVKVLVRENSYMDDVDEVRKILKENLREEKVEQGWIYTGKIRGINDFKTWIREHMVTCIVIEPKYIKEEIRHSLVLRKQMYQEMVENGI